MYILFITNFNFDWLFIHLNIPTFTSDDDHDVHIFLKMIAVLCKAVFMYGSLYCFHVFIVNM